jgi:predicted DCC family thiol-disulfide oxidoreductase YuxK
METQNEHIILFDGVCNLCNRLVRFIIKHDRKGLFRFASLQSEYGKRIQSHIAPVTKNSDTIVYLRKGIFLFRSDAVLSILKDIGGTWGIFYGLHIVPRSLRDLVYNVVASNRYRVFGKRETCMVPSPEIRERFLD